MSIFEQGMFSIDPNSTPEQIAAKRKQIAGLMPNYGSAKYVGEGLGQLAHGIISGKQSRELDRAGATPSKESILEKIRARAGGQNGSGIPGFRLGTDFAPGGMAVVGEDGPELVNLPRGSQVQPNPVTMMAQGMETPDQQAEFGQSRFNDGAAFRTADLAGIKAADLGAGQKNSIQNGAFAYATLMKSLDDYEAQFAESGGTMMPGAKKDVLDTSRRNLQMQMKELYNLGVLNGPDLDLMDQILISPTGIKNNVMDMVGLSDLGSRIPANIAQVRQLMTDLIEPKLRAANINIEDLKPKKEMTDDEYLKSLGM